MSRNNISSEAYKKDILACINKLQRELISSGHNNYANEYKTQCYDASTAAVTAVAALVDIVTKLAKIRSRKAFANLVRPDCPLMYRICAVCGNVWEMHTNDGQCPNTT